MTEQKLMDLVTKIYALPNFSDFVRGTQKGSAERTVRLTQLHALLAECTQVDGSPLPAPGKINASTYANYVKVLKDYLVDELVAHYGITDSFTIVGKVNSNIANPKLCSELGFDITQKRKNAEGIEKHRARITRLSEKSALLQGKNFTIKDNEKPGANVGFTLTTDSGEKYYVKTFSSGAVGQANDISGRLDCCEAFLYKALELSSCGPATEFLVHNFSSAKGDSGSSFSQGAYIITEDASSVGTSSEVKKREFFIDGDDSQEAKAVYREAMKDRDFLVSLYAVASIDSILCLRDSIGQNAGNYGIVKTTMVNDEVRYQLKLIDHLPVTNNGRIRGDYSPGRALCDYRFFSQHSSDQDKHSSLRELLNDLTATGKNPDVFSSEGRGLSREVSEAVLAKNNIRDAVTGAEAYVRTLIGAAPNIFAGGMVSITDQQSGNQTLEERDAEYMLERYVKKVLGNIDTFEQGYAKRAEFTK